MFYMSCMLLKLAVMMISRTAHLVVNKTICRWSTRSPLLMIVEVRLVSVTEVKWTGTQLDRR